jgi:hypothetical protein
MKRKKENPASDPKIERGAQGVEALPSVGEQAAGHCHFAHVAIGDGLPAELVRRHVDEAHQVPGRVARRVDVDDGADAGVLPTRRELLAGLELRLALLGMARDGAVGRLCKLLDRFHLFQPNVIGGVASAR